MSQGERISVEERNARRGIARRAFAFGILCGVLGTLFITGLASCSTIAHAKVEGWPELRTTVHHVSNAYMRERCSKYVSVLLSPLACAEYNLQLLTCDIWVGEYAPSWVIEHERLHCEGHDHEGSEHMATHLKAWRAR